VTAPLVGVLGGGQLGRMLALAGTPLGIRFRFLDPDPDAPARQCGELVVGRYDDSGLLAAFADGLTVVTYEFENVPAATARLLADRAPVFPPQGALAASQDRVPEKELFRSLGIPVPAFAGVETLEDLRAAGGPGGPVGLPCVLKTRRLGYDGKGQAVVRTIDELAPAFASLSRGVTGDGSTGGLIAERMIPFERELSIVAVRGARGEFAAYPLVENVHAGGILRRTTAPAPNVAPALQRRAEDAARAVMERLNYVGVLAIELFDVGGELLVNEMAPRVHNSGHWTQDGAETSQFENHLRAILGWPLGPTGVRTPTVMVNLIGTWPDPRDVLALPGVRLHLYDKAPRPGRKVGHVNVLGRDLVEAAARASAVEALAGARACGPSPARA
jgi:5-(carboxyamino)imidazole ribonucleotide synthase